MTAPQVDIGIPTHGRPQFVTQAVESVLAQSRKDWRLTIAEDGPGADELARVLAPCLDDPRIRYAPTGEHVGAARNMTGLLAGDAPFLAILHDDDRWHPGWLERRVRFLEENPECGFVFSGHIDIDGDGKVRGRTRSRLAEGRHARERFLPRLLVENPVGTPTVLLRRSTLERAGTAFDDSFPRIYDWEMWMRLALASDAVGYLDVWDCEYRSHGSQISAESEDRAAEYLRLLEHGERLARRADSGIGLPGDVFQRHRTGLMLSVALDLLAQGRRRDAARRIVAALRTKPSIVVDRRFPLAVAALLLGARVRRLILKRRRLHFGARPEEPI